MPRLSQSLPSPRWRWLRYGLPRRQLQKPPSGWAYVRRQQWLRAILLLDTVLSFAVVGPLAIGLPMLARQRPQHGAEGFGLMLAGFGAGSLSGLLLAGIRSPQHRRGVAFCLLQICQGPLMVGVAFAPLSLAVALLALMGLLNGVATVMYLSLVQSRVAPDMLGRVMSFVTLGFFGLVPLSQMAAGLVADVAGPETLFLAAGMLMSAVTLGGLLSRPLRQLD